MLQVFIQVLVAFIQRGTIHQFIRIAFAECLQRAPSGFIPIQITVDGDDYLQLTLSYLSRIGNERSSNDTEFNTR